MPTTYTPVLNLNLPEVGASRDTWGTLLNDNATILDQFVSMAMPIGAILDFAGANPPSGWLIADGRAISRTTYAALFAVIGGYWGAGDGSTTFNLPNMIGRSAVGPGSLLDTSGISVSFAFTQVAGSVWQYITQATLPNYVMSTDTQGFHYHGGGTADSGPWNSVSDAQGYHVHGNWTEPANADHTHTGYTDSQGAHQHNVNVPVGGNTSAGGPISPGASSANWLTDVQGVHQHAVQTYGMSNSHQHQIDGDGSHQHNVTITAHNHGIYGDGNHAHNVWLGGLGQPSEVLSPVIVVTKIIYAGTEAATSVMVASAPAPTADRDDELAVIREELAALRALFAPAATRRVTHAPPRGPH